MGDLMQHVQDHLSASFAALFHNFIYFFASKETRNTFMLNPIKYLRQPKPHASLPIKLAIIGPPKSGKTTGKCPTVWSRPLKPGIDYCVFVKVLKEFLLHKNYTRASFPVCVFVVYCNSCPHVCKWVWSGTPFYWWGDADSAQYPGQHRAGHTDAEAPEPGPDCAWRTGYQVPGGGPDGPELQHPGVMNHFKLQTS